MTGFPSLEDLISDASGVNWDWVEKLEKRFGPMAQADRDRVAADRKALAQAAAEVFSGRAGTIVLEQLVKATLRKPIFATQLGIDPQQSVLYGAYREGQNALMTRILQLIAEGRDQDPPPAREL